MIQDGIYQWERVQVYGPSTPMLAQFCHGTLVRLDDGTTPVPTADLVSYASRVIREIEQRLDAQRRFGGRIEFTPTVVLSNPVTGLVGVPVGVGGEA
ncbi:hypothetical protein DEIPH_ctg013orf0007 [Deinococcus phoenicis]|uniref:Uncharacterized protein n=1 Tax=Deinococcus phoenicis TaxID=1476583 RepID=A0A016QRY5_9DEIO|nr:hypothetical protein [Deinococcus phoenicis]EYB68905.1 hypothetical protein DEIPH_ctg013orf0007 [Deinococcus phoenicis]